MIYIQTYDNYITESFLSNIKDKIKSSTNKEEIKHYLQTTLQQTEKMNKAIRRVVITSIIVFALSFITKQVIIDLIKYFTPETQQIVTQELEKDNLLDSIAWKESTNKPDTVNSLGYIGKYQFHDLTLIDGGVVKTKKEARKFRKKFINSSNAERLKLWSEKEQDEAMKNLMQKNKYFMRKYEKYIGDTINGIKITWSGVLAAAHLGGQSNVKQFLRSKGRHDFADANGTKVSDYLSKFSGYKINSYIYEESIFLLQRLHNY